MKHVLLAMAGAALLVSPATASPFIIGAPAIEKTTTAPSLEQTAWRHGGWRGGRWGWGPGAVVGGLALGALAGGYYAYGPYGYGPGYYGYGPGYYGYGGPYGSCWRDAWGRPRCY
jgi:hypothetical protein